MIISGKNSIFIKYFSLQSRDWQPRLPPPARDRAQEGPEREGHLDAPVEELHRLRLQGRTTHSQSGHQMRIAWPYAEVCLNVIFITGEGF